MKPGDIVYVDRGGRIVESVVWRHAGYLVAGHFWPGVFHLNPELEGIRWCRPDALDLFRVTVALTSAAPPAP